MWLQRKALNRSDNMAQSVAISPCGTFALIGSAGGCIDMFNLQSGIHRRSFPARTSALQAKNRRLHKKNQILGARDGRPETGDGKHMKEVTGLMVDGLNRNVVSCGLDGRVKVRDLVFFTRVASNQRVVVLGLPFWSISRRAELESGGSYYGFTI